MVWRKENGERNKEKADAVRNKETPGRRLLFRHFTWLMFQLKQLTQLSVFSRKHW